MRYRLSTGLLISALAASLVAVALGAPGNLVKHSASLHYAAPPMSSVGSGYPINADNGTDIYEDSGPGTVLTAPIIATTGASPVQILAGTAGKKIRILAINLTSSVAGTVQLQDETGTPVKLSGVYTLAANGQLVLTPTKFGYVDTAAGAALDIAVTGSSNVVGGTVTYVLH